jgi:metallo-beta-lactamase class B
MKRIAALFGLIALCALSASAQTAAPPAWSKDYAPFRLMGNVYYVGSEGLVSLLIATPQGHILIDPTTAANAPMIERHVAALGFKVRDIKFLLTSHGHFDHAGGLAKLKADSGALVVASAGDKPLIEGGYYPGQEDNKALSFPPIKVDRVIGEGQTVSLGGVTLTAHITPGHTPGCTTWTWDVAEASKAHHVIYFCSATVAANKLVGKPTYPNIVADYRRTFADAKKIQGDVFLAPHPEMFGLAEKRAAQQKGDAEAFVDPTGFQAFLARCAADFEIQLAAQTKALEAKP